MIRQFLLDVMDRDGFSFLICRILSVIFNSDSFSVLIDNRFGNFLDKNIGLQDRVHGFRQFYLFIFMRGFIRT